LTDFLFGVWGFFSNRRLGVSDTGGASDKGGAPLASKSLVYVDQNPSGVPFVVDYLPLVRFGERLLIGIWFCLRVLIPSVVDDSNTFVSDFKRQVLPPDLNLRTFVLAEIILLPLMDQRSLCRSIKKKGRPPDPGSALPKILFYYSRLVVLLAVLFAFR